ncbi:DUF6319 family protein [Actinopolyspora mortivallis]|uniref:DUF6319 family protein n=1 Tax=Actinopolyspora mortivallis TaxID=33906 RepID=UPI00037950EC|nr:DUF6319 family protein [Actinopolyspora mortivallis]
MDEQQDLPADHVTEQPAQPTEEPSATPSPDEQESGQNQPRNTESGGTEQSSGSKKKGRKQSGARKTRSVELTLTVSGTADGEWQADLTHAGKKIVQGLPLTASSVSKAAGELHTDISEAIESVLAEARQQHEARLAELEAELQRVRKTLEELES